MLLASSALVACSACFFTPPRTTRPGVSQPTKSWAFSYQYDPKDMSAGRSGGGIFSFVIPSSLMTLACIKLTKSPARTEPVSALAAEM